MAPWHVIPADRKWFTRLVVSAAIIDAIQSLESALPRSRSHGARRVQEGQGRARSRSQQGEGGKEGQKKVKRCWWPGEDELYIRYHDEEWDGRSPMTAGSSRRSAWKASNPA
jgi:hypothetical protein